MRIRKSHLSGTIRIPPSKSHTHRAYLFAALCEGTCTIENALISPDTLAMKNALTMLGANFEENRITGFGSSPKRAENILDCGNSGLTYRFLSGVAALCPHQTGLTGDYSIRTRRPIQPLLEAINQLGGKASSILRNGGAPVVISGPIRSGEVEICGKDSQPVSALLTAAAMSPGPFTIHVKDPHEKEWLDVTLRWFDRLGIIYERDGYERFSLPGSSRIAPFHYRVPADFSSAAFPIAAAIVTQSEISVEGLDFSDSQGDKKLFEEVLLGGEFSGGEIDVGHFVDALPILATLACFAKRPTRLFNGAICRKKESDRISAITKELRKMGATIRELPDGLMIKPSQLIGAKLQSHDDHRIAMALAVAAMGAKGESEIEGFSVSCKTYPSFKEDFLKLGANFA